MSVTISGTAGVTFNDASNQTTAATGFGFKNRLLNGAMQIAQRATSATITAGSTIAAGYSTVDRWYVYCTGANVTAAQVAGTGATKSRLQITGAASVTAVGIGQRIEQLNSYDLAGSTATLSLDISNSLLTTVTWTAYYANTADTFGTLASPTRTQIATGTFTVTSTLTNYSTNISIPAAATTGVEIVLTVGAQTSGTWVVGNIQLEKGSTATSFDYRPYGTELALCQRYAWTIKGSSQQVCNGFVRLAANFIGSIQFPVTMRTTAALTVPNSAGYFNVSWGSSDTSMATLSVAGGGTAITENNALLQATLSAATVGQGGVLALNNASSYVLFTAEL
ncbi:hypothetical protein UFOVP160_24 [uncultured Caudovirales phage]|uniref:Uncharacterized protein n=1 Tax=uncultured Caudovirales phage TaxID=2100421 RepID=A0A6J7WAY4_9CAUD|nr:hypothetical protein UFOVP160_24 [uncultured Caudovirales phage]